MLYSDVEIGDLEIGDLIHVVDKQGKIEYIGTFEGFTSHHFYSKLMYIDAKQRRKIGATQWELFEQRPLKAFIFKNNWIQMMNIDKTLLTR